jgi:hypothetical protein
MQSPEEIIGISGGKRHNDMYITKLGVIMSAFPFRRVHLIEGPVTI